MENATESIQRRAHERLRTFVAGRLTFGPGAITLDCTVKDLSTQGARLMVPSEQLLPARMRLEIPSRRLIRDVELRWRIGAGAGVQFLSDHAHPFRAGDGEESVQTLHAEIDRLRTLVAQLRSELAQRVARDDASN